MQQIQPRGRVDVVRAEVAACHGEHHQVGDVTLEYLDGEPEVLVVEQDLSYRSEMGMKAPYPAKIRISDKNKTYRISDL
ncbi:MAG TPA: hypothetical protein VK695_11135 [Steroidobacteraceae bacterium]|nr:hypothetical protein [Steroidobacteraceae bacterium]